MARFLFVLPALWCWYGSYTEGFVFYDHHFFESCGAPVDYPQTRSMIGIDDLSSGKVVGKLDLSSLVEQERNRNPGCDVLNGIAYDPGADKVYVTRKLWSGIYEIKFSH